MRSIASPPPSSQAVSVTEQLPARPATGPAPGIAGAVPVAGWATPGSLLPFFIRIVTTQTSTPDELPELTPYHQKSAFTLGENVRRFCDLYGLQNCGFLTLTFPDNVVDHKEASRRFNNMNRRYLGTFTVNGYGQGKDRKEVHGITTWSCSVRVTSAPGSIGTSTASGSPTTARASAAGCAPGTRCCVPSGK